MDHVFAKEFLLPKSKYHYTKWSCIACDQFTSEKEYWDELHRFVGHDESMLHLILPEAYLKENNDEEISKINQTMQNYLDQNLFDSYKGGVFVLRKTPYQEKRRGLVIAIDLDDYEFDPQKKALIVASEKTVPERIPPRVKIREHAPIESPHILVLIDDFEHPVMDAIERNLINYQKLYDFELNMDGGHLQGYLIDDAPDYFKNSFQKDADTQMIVGDGNHSLATAKVCWEQTKKNLSKEEQNNHPARFALVEIVSIYDPGLSFEGIHRVLFHTDSSLLDELKKMQGEASLNLYFNQQIVTIPCEKNPFVAIKQIQDILDQYLIQHPESRIDFVHGLDSLQTVVKSQNGFGIEMPPLKREDFFPYVRAYGVLPRKSFSLGEAKEKRYYMECRKIIK